MADAEQGNDCPQVSHPPCSRILSDLQKLSIYFPQIETRSAIPIPAVIATTLISCILALISIGSSIVLIDMISIAVSCLYSSYLICCCLLLWRRCTGIIRARSDGPNQLANTAGGAQLVWGSWRLPAAFGVVNNAFACMYLAVLLFFTFWPPDAASTLETINFAVLTTGTVVGFSVVYYLVWARKCYTGPIVEIRL